MVIQVALRNKAKESATILDSSILKKYNSLVKKLKQPLRDNLAKFDSSDMQLTDSSPLMLVYLANSGLLPKDARLATRQDLEKVISRANNFLSEVFVNVGLNLVTPDDGDYQINPVFANSLAKDLKKVGINLKNAKLIPYNLLTYKINKSSPEGLVFRLSEEGKDTAKKHILNTQDFSWDYLPDQPGLFGAFLDGSGDWDVRLEYLADSDSDCRVVVISGKATSRKFLDRYASNFKEKRDESIAAANEKYVENLASLRVA